MSFINKKGKTTSWRTMVVRQQISDVIAYGQIKTTLPKAKETQRHLEKLITVSKKNSVFSKRKAMTILLDTKNLSKEELLKKLFDNLGKKYKDRNGGYTRILKLDFKQGDNSEEAILQLV